jgi:outer membrane murein-binding lipoprotein Lpp
MRLRFFTAVALVTLLLSGCRNRTAEERQQQLQIESQSQQLQQEAALLAQQQQLEQQKQEERRRQEEQVAVYKEAIRTALQEMKKALDAPNLSDRVAALRQIDTSACPPDFRTAFVDYVYDLEQVNLIDVQRARLSSNENMDAVFVTQLIQILTKSDESSLGAALTDDQKLLKAREAWIQQGTEADRALERVSALYDVQY